jgi:hypothetical protein
VIGLAFALGSSGCLSATSTPGTGSDGGGSPGVDGSMGPAPDGGGSGGQDGSGGTTIGTLLCESTLSITGTYQQGNAPPSGFPGGCWPDGIWTFTATVVAGMDGCNGTPDLAQQYQFKVVEDLDYNNTITDLNAAPGAVEGLQISGGDGGLCIGAFMLYSSDGKTVINLRPALQANNVLDGHGDYRIYDADQRN